MNTVRESESGQERRKNTETNREEAGWGDIGSAMLIARLEEYKQIWSSIPANITGAARHQHPKKSSLQPKHETLNSKANAPVMLAGIFDQLQACVQMVKYPSEHNWRTATATTKEIIPAI